MRARGMQTGIQLVDVEKSASLVTVEQAKTWLANMAPNRHLNPDRVEAILHDMMNNKYDLTHQGIAVNRRRQLIDGQHRLSAQVALGKPMRWMVFVMDDSKNIDDGRARSIGDQLNIEGWKNGTALAAGAKAIDWFYHSHKRTLSHEQVRSILEQYKKGVMSMQEVGIGGCLKHGVILGACILAAGSHRGKYTLEIKEFAAQVKNGINLSPGMPAYAVERSLKNGKAGSPRDKGLRMLNAAAEFIRGERSTKTSCDAKVLSEFEPPVTVAGKP